MQEQLITFETAKLAKEKGFDEYTEGFYYLSAYEERLLFEDGIEVNTTYYDFYPEGTTLLKCKYNTEHKTSLTQDNFIAAPTQSLLQKWLREKHNILVEPHWEGTYEIYSINYRIIILGNTIYKDFCGCFDGQSYEQALEIGLQEALKLIKI